MATKLHSKIAQIYLSIVVLLLNIIKVSADHSSLPIFVDVTQKVGIHFKHVNGKTEHRHIIETMGSGTVFFDFDNDGNLDLYIVNSGYVPSSANKQTASNILYRNDGCGHFTDVTAASKTGDIGYGMAAAAADYDNDGYQDLYVANYGEDVLYHNNGDGTFTNVTGLAGIDNRLWGAAVAFLDFDLDGHLDIFVANYLNYNLSMSPVTNNGLIVYGHPRTYEGTADTLYHNNGDNTFTNIAEKAGVINPVEGRGMGVVACDFDNDGWPDIYVANDTNRNFFYHNNGNNTFTDESLFNGTGYDANGIAEGSMGVDAGDYNRDGWLDILVANSETVTLYSNNQDGIFIEETSAIGLSEPTFQFVGFSPLFLDYDNDGYLDIFIANGHPQAAIESLSDSETYAQRDQLFRNTRDGNYKQVSTNAGEYFSQAFVGRSSISGDYNNDGYTDIFIVNSNQRVILLRNEGDHSNNWFHIKLVGTRSNRDGIGAKVRVTAGKTIQTAEMKSGNGYASDSDQRLLFGIGDHKKIDQLEIRWPSGITQRIKNPPCNQIVTITEGN